MRCTLRYVVGGLAGAGIYHLTVASRPDPVVVAENLRQRSLQGEVTIYASKPSVMSQKIFPLLAYHGIPYNVQDVSQPSRRELAFSPSHKAVPLALIAGRLISGSNEIIQAIEALTSNRLPPLPDTHSFASIPSIPPLRRPSDQKLLTTIDTTIAPLVQRAIFSSYSSTLAAFASWGYSPLSARFHALCTYCCRPIEPLPLTSPSLTTTATTTAAAGNTSPSSAAAAPSSSSSPSSQTQPTSSAAAQPTSSSSSSSSSAHTPSPLSEAVSAILSQRSWTSSYLGGSQPGVADFALYGVLDMARTVPAVAQLEGVREREYQRAC